MNSLLRRAREAYYLLHARDTERYAAWLYRRKTGHRLNLDNPRDLNEWINRLSLRTDTSQWSVLADKYRVRRYVEEAGHGDMLTRLYGVWDNAAIDFDALPDRFILKANHGSAMTLAVPDRSALDIRSAGRQLDRWLHSPFGRLTAEPHYLAIPRRVIAEELLDTGRQDFPSTSLIDYKVWCFHGAPRYICVYYDRTPSLTVKRSVYDTGWRARPEYSTRGDSHIVPATAPLPRPQALDAMLAAAADLSAGFPQVRVDFYAVGGRPVFGEMTFTAASGRMTSFTDEFLRHAGDLIRDGFSASGSS